MLEPQESARLNRNPNNKDLFGKVEINSFMPPNSQLYYRKNQAKTAKSGNPKRIHSSYNNSKKTQSLVSKQKESGASES